MVRKDTEERLVTGTYHQDVSKIYEHDSVTFLPSTGDVETHRGHGLGPAALDEVQPHG